MHITEAMQERWRQADAAYHRRRLDSILSDVDSLTLEIRQAIAEMDSDDVSHSVRIECRFAVRRLRAAELRLREARAELDR